VKSFARNFWACLLALPLLLCWSDARALHISADKIGPLHAEASAQSTAEKQIAPAAMAQPLPAHKQTHFTGNAASTQAAISEQALRLLVAPLARRYPGAVVVGIVDDDGQSFACFGKDNSGKPATPATVFEIASITKVFSSLLLAQAAERGQLNLNDPVEKLVGYRVPRFAGQQITLLQLAQHSSGLPPWPTNRGSTCSAYSSADLKSYLSAGRLTFRPGSDISYSNAGFALLGDALAAARGTSFAQLISSDICQPPKMNDTCIGLTADMKKRLAIGHSASGAVMHASAPTAGRGADGICSTAADLIKFVAAYPKLHIGNRKHSNDGLLATDCVTTHIPCT
jgi:CubicO group peptidase (beta-lactamase class C family)